MKARPCNLCGALVFYCSKAEDIGGPYFMKVDYEPNLRGGFELSGVFGGRPFVKRADASTPKHGRYARHRCGVASVATLPGR